MRQTRLLECPMAPDPRFGSVLVCLPVLVSLAIPVSVSAQTTSTRTTRTADAPARKPDPAITAAPRVFPAGGITLEQAVRIALDQNPDAALVRAELARAAGRLLEQQGQFDTRVWGRLFHEYRQQELTQTIKDFEQERRTDLSDELGQAKRDYDRLQEVAGLLRRVRAAAPGSPQVDALAAISPDVASQIRALDVLIAAQPNATVRAQLRTIRDQFVDSALADATDGAAKAIDGYELGQDNLRRLGATPQDEVFSTTGFALNVSRQLRNGLALTPFLDGSVDRDNYRGKPRGEDDGGKGIEDLYSFRGGLTRRPAALARPRHGGNHGARTRGRARARRGALRRAVPALAGRQRHDWTLLGAARGRRLTRGDRLAGDPAGTAGRADACGDRRRRAAAGQPAARAGRRGARPGAAPRRRSVRDGCARGAGRRDGRRRRRARPHAAAGGRSIPGPGRERVRSGGRAARATAAKDRADQQAAQQRQRAADALVAGAEADLRPKLDVHASVWYTALAERTVGAAVDRWVGPSADLQLAFEQPLGNNAAEGRYAQRQAEARQRQIDAGRSAREIALNVIGVAEGIALARARVRHARDAVVAYEQTGTAEVERFRAGESTLIDAILTEDQQTAARISLSTAQQDLARLIAQLRFESGTLLRVDRQLQPVLVPADLTTLPGNGAGR